MVKITKVAKLVNPILFQLEELINHIALKIEMPNKTKPKSGWDGIRLPAGTVLKPPVTLEDLQRYRVHDPEGAEEFVALIRASRKGRVPFNDQ